VSLALDVNLNPADLVWSAAHVLYPWGLIDLGSVVASTDVLTVFPRGEPDVQR
jgi:hypothetical protein